MFGVVALCLVLCGIQIRVLIRASTRSADLFWLGIQIRVLIRASTRSADLFGWDFRLRFRSGQAQQ